MIRMIVYCFSLMAMMIGGSSCSRMSVAHQEQQHLDEDSVFSRRPKLTEQEWVMKKGSALGVRLNRIEPEERVVTAQKVVAANLPQRVKKVSLYSVKKGDTLLEVAGRFQLSMTEIRRINRLKTDKIYPGQKIKLVAQKREFHLVKSGDTLWNIATDYGVTLARVVKDNKLKSDKVTKGQKLLISRNQ